MTYGIAVLSTVRAWATTAGVVLVATLGLVALFWSDALGIYRVWVWSTAYNHCFLVLPSAKVSSTSHAGSNGSCTLG